MKGTIVADADRHTFVLVHGAWHGGWCWRPTAQILRAFGHSVFTPTLTGLGERAHLMNPGITLATHITDVVNVFEYERLDKAVLCGHSYGGWVISGALEEIGTSVSAAVFLDAHVPENDKKGVDRSLRKDALQAAWGRCDISFPPPQVEQWKLQNPDDEVWVKGKVRPHPIGTWFQPITLSGAMDRIPKTYIRATQYPNERFDEYFTEAQRSPRWSVETVDCGHDVMIDKPQWLAGILIKVASRATSDHGGAE